MSDDWMTLGQAEDIVRAANVGMFRGTENELAHALMLIRNKQRDERTTLKRHDDTGNFAW